MPQSGGCGPSTIASSVAYVDNLEGRIDADFYDHTAKDWRKEQEKLLAEIQFHQAGDQSYVDEGVRLVELAEGARRISRNRSLARSAVY